MLKPLWLLSCAGVLALAVVLQQKSAPVQVGIDLGTTYSVLAVCVQGDAQVVEVNRRNLTPSVVHYAPNGEVTVGWPAKILQQLEPERTIHAAKRLMGVKWESSIAHRAESRELGLGLAKSRDTGNVGIVTADGRIVKPEEVGFAVLQELKQASEELLQPWERSLGMRLREVSISVPVSFSYAQRTATIRAAKLAGFTSVHLIEEPIAAAMAYGLHDKKHDEGVAGQEQTKNNRDVLVVDIGGGTLDVALLFLDRNTRAFLIQATAGLSHLGGEDFDMRLADEIIRVIEAEDRIDTFGLTTSSNGTRPATIVSCAEEAKRCLSAVESCLVLLWKNGTCSLKQGLRDTIGALEIPLSRSRFNEISEDLYAQVLQPIVTVLSEAGLSLDKAMDVVLVGGSSRIPMIRTLLSEHLTRATLHYDVVDPDLAVALGTARSWSC